MIAISDLYRDGYTHGGIVNLSLRRAVHRRPGRAGNRRVEQRPVPAAAVPARQARPVAARQHRLRLPRQALGRPVLPGPVPDPGRGPHRRPRPGHGQLERRPAARSDRELRGAVQAQGRGDPAVHGPLHPQGMRRTLCSVHATRRAGRTPPRCSSSSSPSTCSGPRCRRAPTSSSTSRARTPTSAPAPGPLPVPGTSGSRSATGASPPLLLRGKPATSPTPRRASASRSTSTARWRARRSSRPISGWRAPAVLTFRTPVLKQPLRLTGPIGLHLVATSSADDTDWYGKLADVAPDGTRNLHHRGSLRASHRALDPVRSRPERPYHPHTNTTADRARHALRLRHRDLADRLRARAGAPPAAAPHVQRPADAPAGHLRLRQGQPSGRLHRPERPCDQHDPAGRQLPGPPGQRRPGRGSRPPCGGRRPRSRRLRGASLEPADRRPPGDRTGHAGRASTGAAHARRRHAPQEHDGLISRDVAGTLLRQQAAS